MRVIEDNKIYNYVFTSPDGKILDQLPNPWKYNGTVFVGLTIANCETLGWNYTKAEVDNSEYVTSSTYFLQVNALKAGADEKVEIDDAADFDLHNNVTIKALSSEISAFQTQAQVEDYVERSQNDIDSTKFVTDDNFGIFFNQYIKNADYLTSSQISSYEQDPIFANVSSTFAYKSDFAMRVYELDNNYAISSTVDDLMAKKASVENEYLPSEDLQDNNNVSVYQLIPDHSSVTDDLPLFKTVAESTYATVSSFNALSSDIVSSVTSLDVNIDDDSLTDSTLVVEPNIGLIWKPIADEHGHVTMQASGSWAVPQGSTPLSKEAKIVFTYPSNAILILDGIGSSCDIILPGATYECLISNKSGHIILYAKKIIS